MAQSALQFVLAFPEISVTIPGAKTVPQAEENAGRERFAAALEGRGRTSSPPLWEGFRDVKPATEAF